MPNRFILLVDDDQSLRNMNSLTLRRNNYSVLEAECGEYAALLASRYAGSIDLLITDNFMTGMSGIKLASSLMNSRPGLKCLLISGYTPDQIDGFASAPPGMGYLQKPYSDESFLQHVHDLIGASDELPDGKF